MSAIKPFEEIRAWQSARLLAASISTLTRDSLFTVNKDLREQMQRTAISVMSNIAVGFERDGRREFIKLLSIAKASSGEIRSQLYLAKDLGLITTEEFEENH